MHAFKLPLEATRPRQQTNTPLSSCQTSLHIVTILSNTAFFDFDGDNAFATITATATAYRSGNRGTQNCKRLRRRRCRGSRLGTLFRYVVAAVSSG